MSLVIYLEGNIGAGKTTMLSKLRAVYECDHSLVMTEPINDWPSLKPFYMDKRKHALQLQKEVMQSFHERETRCPDKRFYIFERSLRSSYEVFAQLNCTNDELLQLYERYTRLGRANCFPADRAVYIYIRTSATKCLEQVRKRNKRTDAYIDLSYLQEIEKMHDRHFLNSPDTYVIDGDRDEFEVATDVFKLCSELVPLSMMF